MKRVLVLLFLLVVLLTAAPGNPDCQIRNEEETAFIGENIYNEDGMHQTKEQEVASGDTAIFFVKVENDVQDGRTKDNITVRGTNDEDGWLVHYFDTQGGGDITIPVTTSGWATGTLDPHEDRLVRVELIASAPEKDSFEVLLTAQSQNQASAKDAVKAVAIIDLGFTENDDVEYISFYISAIKPEDRSLTYNIKQDCNVILSMHDVSGRKIETLASGRHTAGSYTTQWDGSNLFPQGVYFFVLKMDDVSVSKKVVLLR